MAGEWLGVLKEEESKHNTNAALRERQNPRVVGPVEKPETPTNPASKTSKTSEAEDLGLVATWSAEFGFISVHDPTSGEWHDLHWKDVPGWARWEARKRKELYGEGNRKAHRLTSREMAQIWEAENPIAQEEGIVEAHPIEEGD